MIPKVGAPQAVLIIDFGGGTFDTCIIQTTQSGDLSRGGANAVPLGVQSVAKAGRDIDKGLLDILVRRVRSEGVRFKDDPIRRAEHSAIPVLFFIENAKINLSKKLQGRLFNDLYLSFARTRRDCPCPAVIRKPRHSKDGHLVVTPFVCENLTDEYVLELPWVPKGQLFYWFTEQPPEDNAMEQRLNVANDVISVPPHASNRLRLELRLSTNGEITPRFEFLVGDSKPRQEFAAVDCNPFYFADLRIIEGGRYFGLDFGTSNSYVVEFFSRLAPPPVQTSYPELRVSTRLRERLRELELEVTKLRGSGILDWDAIRGLAERVKLSFVFHSNKIEGNRLTQGETEEAFELPSSAQMSEQQRAALNSERAYNWMLENRLAVFSDTEGFIRHLNGLLLHGLLDDAGKYRSGPVKISGTDFLPPPAPALADMTRQLATEIKSAGGDRSAVELAAAAHTKLVWIHPFSDGNGRTARLLLNSLLLARGLPPIVINFDDRERYMDALVAADGGDLSPFLELILECFDRSLAEVIKPESEEPRPEAPTPSILAKDQSSPIDSALRAIQAPEPPAAESVLGGNLQESGQVSNEDFLASVMEEKLRADQAQYEAWTQAFESVAKQAEALTAEFNRKYSHTKFSASFRRYDMLTREKYDLLAAGKRAPWTWLFSLEVRSIKSRARLIFFFQRASADTRGTARVFPVSLAISRYDGEAYHRLSAEPIWLREIVYAEGILLPVGRDDRNRNLKIAKALELTLAETIKAYL